MKINRKFITLRILGALALFSVVVWGDAARTIWGHHTFLRQGSFIVLGLTLMAGLLALALSERKIDQIGQMFGSVAASKVGVAVFITLVLLALYAINQRILHAFLSSADEHSCYFLAECLKRWRLWVEPHDLSAFFDVVHVGNRDGKWFSVYPIGWPLIWAMGMNWGVGDWLNPMMVSLALGFIYATGKSIYGPKVSFLAVIIIALSPFFLFTGASYFSHGTCLLCVSIFLWAYTKWHGETDERKKILWAALIGLSIGYGLMTRYLTMAAIAAPFIVYELYPIVLRKRKLECGHWIAGSIILVFMACILWQNYAVTGKPFRAPNKHDKSWERLGFRDNYTPIDGLFYLLARFLYLADWFPPYFIVVYFLAIFSPIKQKPMKTLIKYGFLCPVAAYFFYFSWGGNQMGPRYYYSGLPFLGLAVADQFKELWQVNQGQVKKYIIGVLVFSLLANVYFFQKQGIYYEQVNRERKALYVLTEEKVKKPAIIFIHGFLGDKLVLAEEDAVRNSPFMDTLILYAHDKGKENLRLMEYYPEREYYLGRYSRDMNKPFLKKVDREHYSE